MATEQATLSRVSSTATQPVETTRIVLSVCSDPTAPHAGIHSDLSCLLYDWSGSVATLDEASDRASTIIDAGSPAEFRTPHPELDKVVYVFGDSVDDVLRDVYRVEQRETVDLKQVVIPSLGSLGFDLRTIADNLELLAALDVKISIITDGDRIDFPPGSDKLHGFIDGYRAGAGAGVRLQRAAEKRDVRLWSGIDKDSGRAGLGFEWREVDGDTEWVPASNYDEVCAVLEMVATGEMTKSKAAAHLNTSPRSITRAIKERPRRYGLDV